MRALDLKLIRDLRRLAMQAVAIALVMAAGVATLVLALGAHASLEETRAAYYERYRFADIFATARRAPLGLMPRILEIPGVAAAEARIVRGAILDVPGMREPASAAVISVPETGEPVLNRIHLRSGRMPDPGSTGEIVINEAFARAHGFREGAHFSAILNGRKRQLTVAGIGLSPEYVYALGLGDIMPDDRRFGVIWMPRRALEGIFDLDGAFDEVSLRLRRDASPEEAMARLDALLAPYGGTGAYGRKDQQSHAFLDGELKQLEAMSRILPPIFLFVAAFLVNMTLRRLIALERQEIGLMKAVGYSSGAVAAHYLKLVAGIAMGGILIGWLAGAWLGNLITRIYGEFFHFPFLIFIHPPRAYLIAAAATLAAAFIGAVRAVALAVELPPAVAMRPPAPTRYRSAFRARPGLTAAVSQLTLMALRHLLRWPVRAATTLLGLALAVAILVSTLFMLDALDHVIDATFFQMERQDATLAFVDDASARAVENARNLPGVLRVEAFRSEPVRIRHGPRERRLTIVGRRRDADLVRMLDASLAPVRLPETGLVLSDAVATILDARVGDIVEVELLERRGRVERVPVTAIISSYLGLVVLMEIDALDRLVRQAPAVSGLYLAIDRGREDEFFEAVKGTPVASGLALRAQSLRTLRQTLVENIVIMVSIYVSLAAIVAFGVVYNSARISLSERGRELASLRVLGFTRGEVSRVLLIELGVLVALANPLGWVIGRGIAWVMLQAFQSDLYRLPLVIAPETYAQASVVVLSAAAVSALIVRRRIDRLDLVEVLKTRE
jgi:putative ABC transport system permease protein